MDNNHIIELRGVEFHNKGAELMLRAILEKVRQELPRAIVVMEKRGRSAPIHKQREVGIYTKLNFKKFMIDTSLIGPLIPKFIRRRCGFILADEVTVVLDGSGFAFGDFWGAKKAGERLADNIVKWKNQDKKVVLLSQAFGPFKEEMLQSKMKDILDNADLIFARDQYSYKYLQEIPGNKENIMLRPDFTNLIKGKVPAHFDPSIHQVAIIPNNKLLESQTFGDRQEYIQFLIDLCDTIVEYGKRPYFLIHEGEKDLRLAEDANKISGKNIPILTEEDPLYVKGIIGKSVAVITSRFHGLVSSLAQAVPCLCVGWSHKYLALMEDYNFSEGLLTGADLTKDALAAKVGLVLNEDSASSISKNLKVFSDKQKELSQDMWNHVFTLIKN